MAESDDYPELVPESSIAPLSTSDRDVRDAEKSFHHIAGNNDYYQLPHWFSFNLSYCMYLMLRPIHLVARLLQPLL